MAFRKREVVSPKLRVTVEIELTDSLYTVEEAQERINQVVNVYTNPVSNFVVALLRETSSSLWELKGVRVTKP